MCHILVREDSPNSASPPVTIFKAKLPAERIQKSTLPLLTHYSPISILTTFIMFYRGHKTASSTKLTSLLSVTTWMNEVLQKKTWSKNNLLISPPTKPVWPQSSPGAQAQNLTPFVSPTRMEAPKRQEFLSIIIHSAPSLTHGRSSIFVDLIHFSHSIIILLDPLGDTSDTSSGKWVNTAKANGEIWVRELCLIDHSFGTNC